MNGDELLKLRETRAEKAGAAQTMVEAADAENRDLNDVETEEVDGLLTDVETMTGDIRSAEDEIRRKRLATQQAAIAEPAARRTVAPQPNGEVITTGEVKVLTRRRVRGVLRSFKDEEAAYRSGQWIKAQLFGDDRARQWWAGNGESRILQTGSNIGAGYLIPQDFEAAVITNREKYGVIRQFARVLPMGSDTMPVPKYSSSQAAEWLIEGGTHTAGDPAFTQVQLTAKKLARLTRVTSEMLEDSIIDLADWLADDMAQAFAEAEDDAAFNGDKTSSFGGISGIAKQFDDNNSSGLQGSVDAVSGEDLFSEITVGSLTKLMGELPEYAALNASWYCSRVFFSGVLERIAHAGGGSTVETIQGGLRKVYMGHPVNISQKLQRTTTTVDNLHMCLFGDLGRAVILGDRRQIRIQVLDQLYAATDEIGIRATERIDINAHGAGSTTVAGPIVALIGAA